jgi:hypothetical protein
MSELPDQPDAPEEWRSFGGTAMINAAAGVVLPEALLIGPGRVIGWLIGPGRVIGCWQ